MNRITLSAAAVSIVAAAGVAIAATPMAPVAPWAPGANRIAAQWSKMFHTHYTRESALQQVCHFPSEEEIGIKAYPGSLLVDWHKGGGSASNGDDVPQIELATKAPLDEVIAWYSKHYPKLKPKYIFETAGPGITYETTDPGLAQQGKYAVESQGGDFGGCGGLIAAPVKNGYQTGIRIYYQPHTH